MGQVAIARDASSVIVETTETGQYSSTCNIAELESSLENQNRVYVRWKSVVSEVRPKTLSECRKERNNRPFLAKILNIF